MDNIIWLYWDNPPGQTEPPIYIQLCLKSVKKHCATDFDIYLVTTENVRRFLPNISDSFFNIAQINNKSNFLRYTLLRDHGGIWLDSDLIIFRSLKPTLDILCDEIDLVATASPTIKYGEPECGFLLSKKHGKIISRSVSIIEQAIDLQPPRHIFKWGSLGPNTIRRAVSGLKYHHLNHRLLMPIPWWESFRFEGRESIDKYCDRESYGCMLFHEMFRRSNSNVIKMNSEQLMESPTLLGQMFRKAMTDG